ncbi:MAG TPA: EI24 domain-containing protein, partial [Chitinophagaceae bacterium]|nr:EI24 domain-containing protein [Chitinophagaceae bacterium]
LIWGLSLFGIFSLAGLLTTKLASYLDPESISKSNPWLGDALPYLLTTFTILVKLLLHLLLWMVSGTLVKYIVLICLSPLFALLSEKADTRLTGREFPFSLGQLLLDIGRGILISFRNMFLEYLAIFVCFIASLFFPPLAVVTVPLTFLASWYFTGFTLLDYNCERYRFGISQSVQFMKNNRGIACGIGCVYSLFMILPGPFSVIGLMLGPAICVIGATRAFLEINRNSDFY